ncbi:MAG: cyclic nucleotide-binding domain-containing protein [Deltaproteobacteria bacterium]|nr:cyclic nucleotide-binding domain-containing protein [Deltaproteobacteria bacterium]
MDAGTLGPKLAKTFPKGTVLFREGDPGAEMFIILSGSIRVSKQIGNLERTITVMGAGEFIGEMAILTGENRSATATIEDEARLVPIDAAMLENLVARSPEVAVRLLKRLAFRLKATNDLAAILLHRDARVRVVRGVALLVETRGVDRGEDEVYIEVSPVELAGQLGLEPAEVTEVLERLERGGMIASVPGEGGYTVRDLERLREFVDFITARETLGELG